MSKTTLKCLLFGVVGVVLFACLLRYVHRVDSVHPYWPTKIEYVDPYKTINNPTNNF